VSDEAGAGLGSALSGRYTFDRELGRGGMATVWLARDLKHERPVALKVLRAELGAILGAERFLREIRLTAKLQHPHILPLLDSGEAASRFFYVMPYVEGESLRQRLQREGQLPLDEALRLTREVAEALDYAHQQGIIHRDVKPENILLSRGHALMADFGIALAVTQAGSGRLTETGLSLGTPAYMSPEQAMAESRLDGRSDQYSLACVLYEMLAGEPPYTGPTAQAIVAKRLTEPVPHVSTLREVPPGVEAAVIRALARSPADRFANVAAFAVALASSAKPVRGRRRVAWGAGAVLGVLALAALGWQLRPRPVPLVTTHRQITYTGTARFPAVSPDHRWLAYVSGPSLLVQDLQSAAAPASVANARRSLGPPRWTPDASHLLYMAWDSGGIGIYAVSRQGGAPTRLYVLPEDADYALSPSGDELYLSVENSDSILVLDPTRGGVQRAFTLRPVATTTYSPTISPDGRWMAFVGVNASVTFLGICATDGSGARRLVADVPRSGSLAWSPGSDAIYYLRDLGNGANVAAAGDVMKLRIDTRTGAARRDPGTVLGGAFVQDFSLSPDGRVLAYTKAPPQQKLWAMTFDGPPAHPSVQARELTTGTSVFGTPDISPDGRSVAFARNDGGQGNIYVTPFERYDPRPVVASAADEWSPRWSPEGSRLGFAVRDAASPGILVADVGTDHVRRVSADGLAPLGVIAWTADGHSIVFPLDLGLHYAIVDVEGGRTDTLAAVAPSRGYHMTVPSPDGREVAVNAWVPEGSPHWELWRLDRAGRLRVRYSSLGLARASPLLWTADGWIYFLTDDHWLGRAPAASTTASRLVALPQPCSVWETALSGDARRLVCTVGRTEPDVWLADNFDPEERR
jgi:Tol biopolymer transport system component